MIRRQTLRLLASVLLMFLAVASFTKMALAGRYVSDELNTFEIMMYGNLFGFFLVLIFSALTKRLHAIQIGYLRDHFFRHIFHLSA